MQSEFLKRNGQARLDGIEDRSLAFAFKTTKKLSELRSANQEKAFVDFWDRKIFNDQQKRLHK